MTSKEGDEQPPPSQPMPTRQEEAKSQQNNNNATTGIVNIIFRLEDASAVASSANLINDTSSASHSSSASSILPLAALEKTARKVNTNTTTYKRLLAMAHFLLKIRGTNIELWLIDDDEQPTCLDLQPNDLISEVITKDCTLLVEPTTMMEPSPPLQFATTDISSRHLDGPLQFATTGISSRHLDGDEDNNLEKRPWATALPAKSTTESTSTETLFNKKSPPRQVVVNEEKKPAGSTPSSTTNSLYNPASCIPKRSSVRHPGDATEGEQLPMMISSSPATHCRSTPPFVDEDADYACALSLAEGCNQHSTSAIRPTEGEKVNQLDTSSSSSSPFLPIIGSLVAKASCTQFSIQGGRSACTSICLVTASQLLSRMIHNNHNDNDATQLSNIINTEFLDSCLQVGVVLHQMVAIAKSQYPRNHTSVDDLWDQEAFSPLVQSLVRRDTPLTGTIHSNTPEDWVECLMTTLSYAETLVDGVGGYRDGSWTRVAHRDTPVALIVTKPPESILVVCLNVTTGAPWLLLDSHGNEMEKPKRAYARQFDSVQSIAVALCQKFPAIAGLVDGTTAEDAVDSLQMQQLNMFEAHPIMFSPAITRALSSSIPTSSTATTTTTTTRTTAANGSSNRNSNNNKQQDREIQNESKTKTASIMATPNSEAETEAKETDSEGSGAPNPEALDETTKAAAPQKAMAANSRCRQLIKAAASTRKLKPSSTSKKGTKSHSSLLEQVTAIMGSSGNINKTPSRKKKTVNDDSNSSNTKDRRKQSTERRQTIDADSQGAHQPDTAPKQPALQKSNDLPRQPATAPKQPAIQNSNDLTHQTATACKQPALQRGNDLAHQPTTAPRQPALQDSNDLGNHSTTAPRESEDLVHEPTSAPRQPVLQDSNDLVRDPITDMLFADPVFCDKGHTHERTTIEAHFRARREMKEKEEKEGGNSENQCGAGSNYDPTCPLTGEAISDILIPNEQCDKMLPLLIENGLVPLEEGELEDWRERREQKKEAAKKRRAAEAEAAAMREHQVSEDGSETPPAAGSATSAMQSSVDSSTVHILRPLAPCGPSQKQFDLGLAVAFAPTGAGQPPLDSDVAGTSRCSNMCCRSRLETRECQACVRCLQVACQDCLVFHVDDAGNRANSEKQRICPNCVLQIGEVLADGTQPEGEQRVKDLDSMMTDFFSGVKDRKATLQQEVLHFERHQQFMSFKEETDRRINSLEQTKTSLRKSIDEANKQTEVARLDEEEASSSSSSGDERSSSHNGETAEVEKLKSKVSKLQEECDEIDWSQESGVVRGSLLLHELNEATAALAIARSLTDDKGEAVSTKPTPRQRRIAELERQCAEKETEHMELLARGPDDEEDFDYAIALSRLSLEFDQLTTELASLKREEEGFFIPNEEESRNFTTTTSRRDSRRSWIDGRARAAKERERARRHSNKSSRRGGEKPSSKSSRRGGEKPSSSSRRRRSSGRGRSAKEGPSSSRTRHSTSKPSITASVQQVAQAAVTKTVGEFFALLRREPTTNDSDDESDFSVGTSLASVNLNATTDQPLPASSNLDAESVEVAKADLAAIGVIGVEELVLELPLGLRYPSHRMTNQVRILKTDLDLARIESERQLEGEYSRYNQDLESSLETIEDEVVELRKTAASAQESAAEEVRLRQERQARREALERERKRREDERRREEARLQEERRNQEKETRQALRGLDLRQCGGCGFGPFEKFNCNDMRAHNDMYFYMDANGRRRRRGRNECPQCGWTNSRWDLWPRFQP